MPITEGHSTGELIAAALATTMAFFGALGAALKFWSTGGQPEKDDPMEVLRNKVADIERRQDAMDDRIDEVFRLMGSVKDALAVAQADVREALTRLQERRK